MTADKTRKTNGKRKEVFLLSVLGVVLCLAVWLVLADGKTLVTSGKQYSETERKLVSLLEEMNGVGEAEVMVCETEEGVQSVVVVCDGARDFKVVMTIREAVAAALGTEEKTIKIYQKKE